MNSLRLGVVKVPSQASAALSSSLSLSNACVSRWISSPWTLFPTTNTTTTIQTRAMSKFMSKAARKRQPLTTKQATKMGYYKGKRSTKEGVINNKGRYFPNPLRKLELVVPDLTGFKLKPYIVASASKYPPEDKRGQQQTVEAPIAASS